MRLKKVNNRILQVRNDGWFWDSQITPELTKYILCLKDGEEVDLKAENGSITVIREDRKFYVNSEEYDEQFGVVYSSFILWEKDLQKIGSSPKKKLARETLHTAVNASLYPRYRSSIRAFKKALRRAKRRSCHLDGFTEIRSVTALSAGKFLHQQGFRISPDGELSHPRGRKSTAERLSNYKVDNLLRGFGL